MNTRNKAWPVALAGSVLLMALAGCDDGTTTGGGAQSTLGKSAEYAKNVAGDIESRDAQLGGAADALTGASDRIELKGLAWSIPQGWENMGRGSMAEFELAVPSSATYQVRAKFFGEIGGTVSANIARWAGQMSYAGSSVEPRITERTLDGIKVTIMEMDGTFTEGMASGAVINRDLFAFRAAVAEGPQGNVFIKMVGPEEVIEEIQDDWDRMVSSMQRN